MSLLEEKNRLAVENSQLRRQSEELSSRLMVENSFQAIPNLPGGYRVRYFLSTVLLLCTVNLFFHLAVFLAIFVQSWY